MQEAVPSILQAVPIFPLPEVVLFPGQVLPLHIFEPRYCAMTADALAGEGLLAIALLKPGYEPQYFTPHAPMHDVLGVGRVVAARRRDDGRYDILLHGFARARLIREYEPRPYRSGDCRVLGCTPPSQPVIDATRAELLQALSSDLHYDGELQARLLAIAQPTVPLPELLDRIAGELPAPGEVRQCFLAETDLRERARALLRHIRTLGRIAQTARRRPAASGCDLN